MNIVILDNYIFFKYIIYICQKIAGFRGDYEKKLSSIKIENIALSNSLNYIYIYQLLDKINFSNYNSIYLCGNYIEKIKKYYCKNIQYDLW